MKYNRKLVVSVDVTKTQVQKALRAIKKCNAVIGEVTHNNISASTVEMEVPVEGKSAGEIAHVIATVDSTKGVAIKDVLRM